MNRKIQSHEIATWATHNHHALLEVYENYCEETGQEPSYTADDIGEEHVSLPEFAITMFGIGNKEPSLLRSIFADRGYAVATPKEIAESN